MPRTDILFDITTREISIKNGDFDITDNASTQNGGILLNSHCAFRNKATIGIGLNQVFNMHQSDVSYELARFKQQAKQDGAKEVSYSLVNSGEPLGSTQIIKTQVGYD